MKKFLAHAVIFWLFFIFGWCLTNSIRKSVNLEDEKKGYLYPEKTEPFKVTK